MHMHTVCIRVHATPPSSAKSRSCWRAEGVVAATEGFESHVSGLRAKADQKN